MAITRKRKRDSEQASLPRERTNLMSLPPELREIIWFHALAGDEPLICYLAKRTTRLPTGCEDFPLALERQSKRYPQHPPLTLVSRQVRKETLPVFYNENIFSFSLDDRDGNQIGQWQDFALPDDTFFLRPTAGRYEVAASALNAQIWTVRLEFVIESVAGVQKTHNPRYATIDVRLNAENKLVLTFGGALADECTCYLQEQATKIPQRQIVYVNSERQRRALHHRNIADYARFIEKEINDDLRLGNRLDNRWKCTVCGKDAGMRPGREAELTSPIPGRPRA